MGICPSLERVRQDGFLMMGLAMRGGGVESVDYRVKLIDVVFMFGRFGDLSRWREGIFCGSDR